MKLYLYKVYHTGRYTKYEIYVDDDGKVLIYQFFKKTLKKRHIFTTRNEIDKVKNVSPAVKESAKWALYEAKSTLKL